MDELLSIDCKVIPCQNAEIGRPNLMRFGCSDRDVNEDLSCPDGRNSASSIPGREVLVATGHSDFRTDSANQPSEQGGGAKPKKTPTEATLSLSQEKDNGKGSEMNFYSMELKSIPKLQSFSEHVIDFSCNKIQKIENLAHCKELRELKLYGNQITIVENLDKLTKLAELQLQHNRIKAIGKGLSKMKNLQVLRLDNNKIQKIESRELASCSNLRSIDVSFNKLDDLMAFNCLPKLEELYATHNRLKLVLNLQRYKMLQEVDFSFNKLTDVSGLKDLPCLQIVNVSDNSLTSLDSLGNSKSLKELHATNNQLTNVFHLPSQFPNLEILLLSGNLISSWEHVCSLSKLSELTELALSPNPIVDNFPSYEQQLLKDIPNLWVLNGVCVKNQYGVITASDVEPELSAAINVKAVEAQFHTIENVLTDFEKKITNQFSALKIACNQLPAEKCHSQDNECPPFISRCSSRARIFEAQMFAAKHF